MAFRLYKFVLGDVKVIRKEFATYAGKKVFGTPPEKAKNLKQRLKEINYKDPKIHYKVDIGLPLIKKNRHEEMTEKLSYLKSVRSDGNLEKLSQTNQLVVPLDEVTNEWKKTLAPFHIKQIAEHYGIFQDLFGDAYFLPLVVMDITYKNGDKFVPVFRGNDVKPSEASVEPVVEYEAEPDSLWTLILTNPDGHLSVENAEYVHWFIGNIPGNDIKKGEVVFDYLQPFPPYGTGFHRYIFVLYKQEKKMDFSKLKKKAPCLELNDRTFMTYDFYRENQDVLTPAGLSFFQSDWDPSLTDFFHKTLNMSEPIYEYDFPPPYLTKQKWFPKKKAFNIYLDKYRDPKKIAEEFLLKKLKETHPFKPAPPRLPYPGAVSFPQKTPSWIRTAVKKERFGWGRIAYHDKD